MPGSGVDPGSHLILSWLAAGRLNLLFLVGCEQQVHDQKRHKIPATKVLGAFRLPCRLASATHPLGHDIRGLDSTRMPHSSGVGKDL